MKRRAPEIADEAKPSPRTCVFQTRRGRPLGQESSSPVSGEIPSRLGPRHCGQSAAVAQAQNREAEEMNERRVPPHGPPLQPARCSRQSRLSATEHCGGGENNHSVPPRELPKLICPYSMGAPGRFVSKTADW